MKLWRFNQVTGYWVYQRTCAPGTENAWLTIFKRDDPKGFFKLSKNKPSRNPVGWP